MKEIEFKIKGLMMDPVTNSPIVVLQDTTSDTLLPIWVGIFEANAIALQIENVTTPRPMTHDLLRNVIHDLKADIQKIVVSDLKENTYYALLHLETKDGPKQIDSRPSDAIALALRCDAPIFVAEGVIEAAQNIDLTQGHQDAERFRAWLEGLDDDEFGKYEV